MAAQEDKDSPAIDSAATVQEEEFQNIMEQKQEPFRASAAQVFKNSFASSDDKIGACDGKFEDFMREDQNMVEGILFTGKRDLGSVANVEGRQEICDSEKLKLKLQAGTAIDSAATEQEEEFQNIMEEKQEQVRTSAAQVSKNSFASSDDKIGACDGKFEDFPTEGQNMVEGILFTDKHDLDIVANVEETQETSDSEKLELQTGTGNGDDAMKERYFLEQGIDRSGIQESTVHHEKAVAERGASLMVNEDSVSENALEVKKKLLLEELEAVLRPEGVFAAENLPGCQLMQEDFTIPRSLGIEVIDDTALIETVPASVIAKKIDVLGNRKSTGKGAIKEIDVKNGKRSRRKAKGAKNGGKTKSVTRVEETQNLSGDRKDGAKRKYSRKEIEAVRFVNMAEQRIIWKAIYGGLDIAVANEYDNLVSSELQRHKRLNYDSQQCLAKKKEAPAILMCCENMDNELQQIDSNENVNPMDPCSHSLGEENGCTVSGGECCEDDDSEDDYDSIQKPAFLVDGEPNFDLGPPEDGWEYLRRVRWEAAQIPRVKVVKLDRSMLNEEQSAYMPKIADIAKCPEHLLPSKQWENVFLAEFSELRAKLSQLEGSSFVMTDELLHHSHETTREPIDQPTLTAEHKDSSSSCPLLSTNLRMDSVARVSMLNKRIRSLEPLDTIKRNDCMWLFALCATVDAPLDADTCAALRGLLRKCASLRAMKTEHDDEVMMLNILATISGKYFGQAEN